MNDVRAIDWSYKVFSVVTRNTGCLPFTDQMACCTSVSKPSVPVAVGADREHAALDGRISLSPPQMYRSIRAGQYANSGGFTCTPLS